MLNRITTSSFERGRRTSQSFWSHSIGSSKLTLIVNSWIAAELRVPSRLARFVSACLAFISSSSCHEDGPPWIYFHSGCLQLYSFDPGVFHDVWAWRPVCLPIIWCQDFGTGAGGALSPSPCRWLSFGHNQFDWLYFKTCRSTWSMRLLSSVLEGSQVRMFICSMLPVLFRWSCR